MTGDRGIRWSTALAVLDVAAVAAMAPYEHAYDLVRGRGESGWTARMVPLTVNGLIYARSMVMLDSARRNAQVPPLVRRLRVRRPDRELPALLAAIRCRRRLQRRWRVRWRPGGCPSVRVIRVRLHIGQSRAQRVRAFLTALINA